jgi:hypothetical protein
MALREPSLYCGDHHGEMYRLSRLEWTGIPVFVTLAITNEAPAMTVVKLQGPAWNLPPGLTVQSRLFALTSTERDTFLRALGMSAFWTLPSLSHDGDAGVGGSTTWILEGRRGSSYHVVSRYHVGSQRFEMEKTPFIDLARLLLGMAGVTEEELRGNAPGVQLMAPRPQLGDPPPPPPPPPGYSVPKKGEKH